MILLILVTLFINRDLFIMISYLFYNDYIYTQHPNLDELYLQSQFRWAGHVARLPSWRGKNTLTDIMRYRDIKWPRRQQNEHGYQGHDKRIRVWRWEKAITDLFGED